MAVVLLEFENAVSDDAGRAYGARVCGRQAEDRLWEGWIEFMPRDGEAPIRTPRETSQPKFSDLEYWATGLTAAYLEGALERALHPEPVDLRPREVAARAAFDGPAPDLRSPAPAGLAGTETLTASAARAVLNPFEVYAQGEDTLRAQLIALDEGHLRNIIRAHDLIDPATVDLPALARVSLVDLIVAAVRARVR